MTETAVLLCGHGSRDVEAIAEFEAMAGRLKAKLPQYPMGTAYLEFARPMIREGLEALRQAGAKVRHVLVQAASEHLGASAGDLRTEPGRVVHNDGRSATYAELAPIAARLQLPAEAVPLKDPKQYRILGTRVRVVDADEIVTGRARYGIDSHIPGALIAVRPADRCVTIKSASPRPM